jgi:hypothetical protein
MTVDIGAAGLKQADGSKRANVQGDKSNMGYLEGVAGKWTDTHEIGHMLGFKDRYTDYQNAANPKQWGSISHDGYRNDLFGAGPYNATTTLNQSHYDDAVRITNYKLTVGQANLLPTMRSNSVNVTANFDASTQSATSPTDIPAGWIKR